MIANLLHKANSSPPPSVFGLREEFYAMKRELLERYGTPDGYDVQYIPGKVCFGCDGTRVRYYFDDYFDEECSDDCHRCWGSGWWKSPKWVTLKRTKFGPYTFHTPEETSYTKPEPDVTRIEGYVTHKGYPGRQSELAFLWLCLLTGRFYLFWRQTTSGRPCGWQWHPFLILSQIACPVVWHWQEYWRTCDWCERRAGVGRSVCRMCEEKCNEDTEAPF